MKTLVDKDILSTFFQSRVSHDPFQIRVFVYGTNESSLWRFRPRMTLVH